MTQRFARLRTGPIKLAAVTAVSLVVLGVSAFETFKSAPAAGQAAADYKNARTVANTAIEGLRMMRDECLYERLDTMDGCNKAEAVNITAINDSLKPLEDTAIEKRAETSRWQHIAMFSGVMTVFCAMFWLFRRNERTLEKRREAEKKPEGEGK